MRFSIKRCLKSFEIISVNSEVVSNAMEIHSKYGFSFWDSQVLAAALEAGCSILYTEDIQHNQFIEGKLRIINPFIK